MPNEYTLQTTIFVLSFLFFIFIVFMYWPVIYAFFTGRPVDENLRAKKPTKQEIANRNTINYLLMSDEMEDEIKQIELHETEKAIS